jgi:hypothetical protein
MDAINVDGARGQGERRRKDITWAELDIEVADSMALLGGGQDDAPRTNFEKALYVSQDLGVPVFPLWNCPDDPEKHRTPMGEEGAATKDPHEILEFWYCYPEALVGANVPKEWLRAVDEEREKIKAALAVIDPDRERDAWFQCLCAIYNEYGAEEGLVIADEWSRGHPKYSAHELRKQWQSIVKKGGYNFTFATIFYHANKADPEWSKPFQKPKPEAKAEPKQPEVEPSSLADVHAVCRKWLGDDYDLDNINAVCAVAANNRLTGDPCWLLLISGPGAAKTETVQALSLVGHVTSTIASEGALLSASSRKERAKNATGGLLRRIGERGILVIKDVTTILSADRHARAQVLAAMREIYDGFWERNVGTDGGQTLTWRGHLTVIGAVTTAWDAAHAVIATMGDRFLLLRIDSGQGRVKSGLRAMGNIGQEVIMRKELAETVGGLIAHATTDGIELTDEEIERLLKVADLVTLARTAVERDFKGDVIDAHAPEMPTRFGKQLAQVVRGGVAIGMDREAAMLLALRCARDSFPPLRLLLLHDLADNPSAQVHEMRERLDKPWPTIKRELDALHTLGLVTYFEETIGDEEDSKPPKKKWTYDLNERVDRKLVVVMATGQEPPSSPSRGPRDRGRRKSQSGNVGLGT